MRVLLVSLAIMLTSSVALADVDCPAGTKKKSEGANDWCEPSVCANDAQCLPGEVCKPVPLCVEIGTLKGSATQPDAGQRLMARQKCGPDRSCPASTSCLDGNRCLSKADAEKMGLLGAAAAPSASAGAASGETKKCGCRVAGAPSSSTYALLAGAVGIALLARRRRR